MPPATVGPDEAGDHPGAREHGEDPGPQRRRVGAADRRVGDGGDRAGADALQHAGRDEHRHRRRGPGDGDADAEQHEPEHERRGGAAPVGALAGEHGADERAEEEAAEHPAVEGEVAEVVLDLRHHRRDGERLEGHQRDGEDQPDRQPPPLGAKTESDGTTTSVVVGPGRATPSGRAPVGRGPGGLALRLRRRALRRRLEGPA